MQDKFEEFVRQRRDEFDEFDLPDQVWTKVQKRLPSRITTAWIKYVAIAATIVLLVGSFGLFRSLNKQSSKGVEQSITSVPDKELSETERYYTGVIAEKETELNNYKQKYPELCHEFSLEIDTLNRSYTDLKIEYTLNAGNEMVQHALIQNLQTQVQLIEQQLQIIAGLRGIGNDSNS